MEVPISPDEVIERIKYGKKRKIKVNPVHVVRASEIGHPCERYLVYCITQWEQRTPHSPETEMMFEGGRVVEDLAVKDFEEAGFKVYRPEPDKAIMSDVARITGHIDIRVDFANLPKIPGLNQDIPQPEISEPIIITGEIKGLNLYDWGSLDCLEDFFSSNKVWIRKYPAQLEMYLDMKDEDLGFFYLKSIPGFRPKFIWIFRDKGYVAELKNKALRVERHVADGTLPSTINEPKVCQYCGFLHICLPEIKQKELEFIDDPDFETKLLRRDELDSYRKEYDALDKEIKSYCKGRDRLMIGDFLITGSEISRKGYVVADTTYWKVQIARLSGRRVEE